MDENILAVRTSELSTYRSCRQKWAWAYLDKIRSKSNSAPLAFGTLIHETLARFYKPGIKRGGHPAAIWEEVFAEFIAEGNEDFIAIKAGPIYASELGLSMMQQYWELYGKDNQFKIIEPEQSFQLDIFDENDDYLCTYTGTVDAVVEDRKTKRRGFFEHKTGASLDPFGAPLILDEQCGAYWTFGQMFLQSMGVIGEEECLDFVLYNRLRKTIPDNRTKNEDGHYVNKNGTISKSQPPPMFKREYSWRTDAERQSVYDRVVLQVKEMKMVRSGELGIYKNPDKHCGWCEFRDMCEVHESQSDWVAIRNATMTTWDPYEDHNDKLGESK